MLDVARGENEREIPLPCELAQMRESGARCFLLQLRFIARLKLRESLSLMPIPREQGRARRHFA